MKRLTAILLILIMVIALFTGCKKNPGKQDGSSEYEEIISVYYEEIVEENDDKITASSSNTNSDKNTDKDKENNDKNNGKYYKKRELYKKVKFDDYIKIGKYKGLEVDTKSDEYKAVYQEIINTDVDEYGLYKTIKSDATVANGDTVNLDYEGKIDGVAFQGGTSKGYNLVIGSGTFIDDFEEELIGTKIGETRDITAKFPENYGNEKVNGKEAIFTCKINYIERPMTVEESYKKMGFNSADEYYKDIKKRATKTVLLNKVCDGSKISNYPEKDSEKFNTAIYETYVEMFKTKYNADLEEVLAANGTTVEAYKTQIKTQMVPPMMKTSMAMYCILDLEDLKVYESTVKSQDVSQPVIAECYAVQDTVLEYLYDNAVIK